MPRLAAALIAATAAIALAFHAPASAQTWPTQPLKLLVGFPGGSTPDITARAIADKLGSALGQPIVIDNRPGASGNIAADAVAKATDDHTLGIVINGNLTTSKTFNAALPFDPERDFAPISLLATAPLVLVTQPDKPAGRAFFDAARAAGDKWSYGSVGNGSLGHVGMEALKSAVNGGSAAGFAAVHVPYKGNPQVVTALLAGEIQLALVPPGLALPQVQAGKLRAVGVTSAGRSPLAPGLPPLAETGVTGFELEVWNALVGPASLGPAARARLAAVLPPILKDPDVRQKLFVAGWHAEGSDAAGLSRRVAQERETMRRLVEAGRVKSE